MTKPLQEWTDAELAAVMLSALWFIQDGGGTSHGRSLENAYVEAIRDLRVLPESIAGPGERPGPQELLDEAQRRRLIRPTRTAYEAAPQTAQQTALMTPERSAELRWFALNLRRLSPENEGDSLIESLDAMAFERARADAALVVARAAARVVAAADACDREAERHPSSRSSAPVVRAINAMKELREALAKSAIPAVDDEPFSYDVDDFAELGKS